MAEQKSKNKTNKKNNNKKVESTKKVIRKEKAEFVNKEIKNDEFNEAKNEKVTVEKKEKKKIKLTSMQKDYILVVLVIVVLIIAFVLTGGKKLDIELPIALEGTAGFTEITYSEYEERLNKEEPFVVVIVNEGCGYCEMYEPVVEEVANEYQLPLNYINLANLTTEERTLLSSSNSYLKNKQWGTPTTLFLYGDTVVDSIGGYVDKDGLVDFVKENFVVENND